MVARVEPWGFFIVMALVIAGVVNTLWMQPVMNLTYGLLDLLLTPLSYLIKFMSTVRVLTGITTSGTPHLGNYVGAIRPAIAASRAAGVESFYFLADYHALIKIDEPARIQRSTLEIAASWLACRAGPRARDLLPPVRHPRDSGADLVADLRHRQGPAQSRARLQGGGGQEQRRRRGPRRRRHRRPVHVPGADGGRHPDVQRAPGAGGTRPDPAHRDGARHGAQLQPPLWRSLRAARGARSRKRWPRCPAWTGAR